MFELILLAPVAQVEALSEALDALDALSVSVEDADAQTPAEQALFGEPGMPPPKAGWERSRVVAHFSSEAAARDAATVLAAQDFFAGCQVIALQSVPEQDWVRLTQSQFAPVEITPEFWIVPTWHQPPEQARQLIRLDPGLAFGTGTHPTTRMCLRWIAANGSPARASGDSLPLSPKEGTELARGGSLLNSGVVGKSLGRVLDYGCGSGILAIGAAKFGASAIDALDIDEAAVQSTLANAEANHVRLNAGLPDKADGLYQTVLANILATPLKVLAPLLCARVAPGGTLVLAGILDRQADELTAAYAPYCQLQVTDQEDGWILMTARL
ncbi:MAG: 50S ribosomal protein L11 methyltransferase [Polaromonas sp.]|uniref:50S ribosomal protein L11 methyltransferase n=1 Tax=Polaromonas sp. TaxID=1869339 RepID=UPI00272F1F82|nr:50S ribosomal protein L11 methyltransferase [Polaromonas sp.]MDP1740428.1 50S ribosomal protein L11 methyltransferase [Polaromonas sp.]MDP1956022.1 50S ribosomal protein L11 methyltransferase [Polaromonas sp.]MDP3355044.1 50S ribosomal protein L11 methyltransferase [Polaromonas sp.]MDP3751188.1 50S ribosomal protein L11 methyltransferase [Polaromonas sp.]